MNANPSLSPHARPRRPLVGVLRVAAPSLALSLIGAAVTPCGAQPDVTRLESAVVDLEVHRPGEEPQAAVGFYLGDVGLVTAYRLVGGAEWVAAHSSSTSEERITEYLAADGAADLVVLRSTARVGLPIGASGMLARAQGAFAGRPPSDSGPPLLLSYWRTFQATDVGEMISLRPESGALAARLSGVPLVDSLGAAAGMIEVFPAEGGPAYLAVPIERLLTLLAQPDPGGRLADLSPAAIAPWALASRAEHLQAVGGALCRAGRLSAGMELLDRARQADSTLSAAWLEFGMAHQMQGDHSAAEELYRRALTLRPRDAVAHLYLGSCLFMQGIYLQSQRAYEAAIDAAPEWAMPHVNLAGTYIQQGKPQEAERALRQALAIDPDLGIAYSNLGVVLYTAGRTDEAREILDRLRSRKSGYATQLHRQTFGRSGR